MRKLAEVKPSEDEIDPTPPRSILPPGPRVFPTAMVPLLRDKVGDLACLRAIDDELLGDLLTSIFFAGLETEEGEPVSIRATFVGADAPRVVMPEGEGFATPPMLVYRWTTLAFEQPRPFTVPELVKLSVVTTREQMFTRIELHRSQLLVTGLLREGHSDPHDPFLKIMTPHAGALTIQRGRERLIEYERGRITTEREALPFSRGLLRRALTKCASAARLPEDAHEAYVGAVRELVGEMVAHGRGGVLVVSGEERPELPPTASYRLVPDVSLTASWMPGGARARGRRSITPRSMDLLARVLGQVVDAEVERTIAQFGALTALDGATLLDRSLTLLGFGVVLPVLRDVHAREASDLDGRVLAPFDLATRGTRHRAGVSYASQHPGSVVFVASKDGGISAMTSAEGTVVVWRFGRRDCYR